MKRHCAVAALLAGMTIAAAPALHAQDADAKDGGLQKVRLLMNSGYTGANAWLPLADDLGFFADEGIEIEFVAGKGAFTAAPRMVEEGYDFGYGDFQALIEAAARDPETAPIGVYVVMENSPSVIAVSAASDIETPADVAGKMMTAHPTDVGLNTFEQFASKAGIDAKSITATGLDAGCAELLTLLKDGETDGLFGYISTISAAVRLNGDEVGSEVRFLEFKDVVPELYGSVLMVAPGFAESNPEAAQGVVNAFNRGVMAAVCDPDAAIEALVKRDDTRDPVVERLRLVETIREDMGGADKLASGIGEFNSARVESLLAMTAETRGLARQPTVDEVTSAAFLPDLELRQAVIDAAPCKAL